MRGGIQARLTLFFICLAAIPSLIVGIVLAWGNYVVQQRQALELQREVARRVSAQVSAFFEKLESQFRGVGESEGLPKLERKRQIAILSALRHQSRDVFDELTLLDKDGRELVQLTRLRLTPVLGDRSRADEFIYPKTRGRIYYSPIDFEEATGEPLITVALPVYDFRTGGFQGVLAARVRIKRVWELIASIPVSRGQDVYIVDVNGRVIAHRNPSVVLRNTNFNPGNRNGIRPGLSGTSVVLAVETARLGDQEFNVVAEQAVSEALTLAFGSLYTAVPVILAAIAAAIGLGVLVVRKIVGPIRMMADTAQAISAGDLSRQVEVTSRDEVGELAKAFNSMTAQLHASLSELEWYFTNALDLLCIADKDGRFRRLNKEWENALGYPIEEVKGRSFIDFVHPDDKERSMASFARLREKGEVRDFINRCVRKDGGFRWIEWRSFSYGDIIYAAARDITKRKQDEDEIHRLNLSLEVRVAERTAQLEETNKELQSFAYSIAHDLRAPLRAINGYTHIIFDKYGDTLSEDVKNVFSIVQNEALHMDQLITSLLDLSRIGRYSLKPETLDMGSMVRSAFQAVMSTQARTGIELRLGELPGATGDPSLIGQVWTNLLSNAVKFSTKAERALICVEGSIRENEIVYGVRDNGIGFDMRYAGKLFGIFQRLHSIKEFEGNGIGLALVHRIISMHGGRVWAEGEVGKGAVFSFSLPRAVPFHTVR